MENSSYFLFFFSNTAEKKVVIYYKRVKLNFLFKMRPSLSSLNTMSKFFDFTVKDIKNQDWNLNTLKGKVK